MSAEGLLQFDILRGKVGSLFNKRKRFCLFFLIFFICSEIFLLTPIFGATTNTVTYYYYDETVSTNGQGRLTSVTDQSGTTQFNYDIMGRTTVTYKTTGGVTYTTQTGYDTIGRVNSVSYPEKIQINGRSNPVGYKVIPKHGFRSVIPAKAGNQQKTGFRVKAGMTKMECRARFR